MKSKQILRIAALVTIISAGCSSLPGLRVLTGQDTGQESVNRAVQSLDLVMADKTGATDPSLMAAADRIEAASRIVDVIEIRPDLETDTFVVNMLYAPPSFPQTVEGQVMALDTERRTHELVWQAVLNETEGLDAIHINLLHPEPVTTLDSGSSFVAYIIADTEISRADAANYLAGERTLNDFYDLIVNGTLNYTNLERAPLYEGRPNHPMFMLSRTQAN